MKEQKKGSKFGVVVVAFVAFVALGHGKHHHFGIPSLDSFGSAPAGATTASSNEHLAMHMAREAGWDHRERRCLNWLWTRESGFQMVWNTADSGAYGIPQALPASKMASAGSDYMTNPATQIKWGIGYIKGRYGTACAAWDHEESAGWY